MPLSVSIWYLVVKRRGVYRWASVASGFLACALVGITIRVALTSHSQLLDVFLRDPGGTGINYIQELADRFMTTATVLSLGCISLGMFSVRRARRILGSRGVRSFLIAMCVFWWVVRCWHVLSLQPVGSTSLDVFLVLMRNLDVPIGAIAVCLWPLQTPRAASAAVERMLCAKCGYVIGAVMTARCPECGRIAESPEDEV